MRLMDTTFLLHLPTQLLNDVKHIARANGFSAGDFCRQSIKRNLAAYRAHEELTKTAAKPQLGF